MTRAKPCDALLRDQERQEWRTQHIANTRSFAPIRISGDGGFDRCEITHENGLAEPTPPIPSDDAANVLGT